MAGNRYPPRAGLLQEALLLLLRGKECQVSQTMAMNCFSWVTGKGFIIQLFAITNTGKCSKEHKFVLFCFLRAFGESKIIYKEGGKPLQEFVTQNCISEYQIHGTETILLHRINPNNTCERATELELCGLGMQFSEHSSRLCKVMHEFGPQHHRFANLLVPKINRGRKWLWIVPVDTRQDTLSSVKYSCHTKKGRGGEGKKRIFRRYWS